MCQKAAGNVFIDLVGIRHEHLTWTRGKPSEFNSSDVAARGFCSNCGTPLYYRSLGGPHVSMTIGSFDTPHLVPILYEMGLEGRHPSLRPVPGAEQIGTTEEGDGVDAVARVRASNHQHPDHDTDKWVTGGADG
ncbi:MAG: GFA family protein [Hyphomicrobiales bacterium]|nr:MAG: GFA family protein [Hyphomicrobiales bacterium]